MSERRRTVRFAAPETVEIIESTIPEPGPDEVRVRTTVSAVSPGTELLLYRGEAPTNLAADPTIDALAGDLSFPLSYGYAAVGEVTAVGDEVDDRWRNRTVFAFHPHDSHFLANPADLIPVSDLQPGTAALLPNLETAVNFLMDGQPMVGERVAVFGQGVVGLLTTALLAKHPLAELIAVEPRASRRRLAEQFGADRTVDPEQTEAISKIRTEKIDGWWIDAPGTADTRLDAQENSVGLDLAYEVSGNPKALNDAIAATGYDGRVLVGSWYGRKQANLDLGGRFHRNRIRVESSQVSTIDPEHRGRWTSGRRLAVARSHLPDLDTDALVTNRVPVDDASAAYDRLSDDTEDELCILLTYD